MFVTVSKDCRINALGFLLANYMLICPAQDGLGFNPPRSSSVFRSLPHHWDRGAFLCIFFSSFTRS